MITFILLAFFAMLAILFAAVAYTANQRRRAGMKGVDPSITTGRRQGRAAPPTH